MRRIPCLTKRSLLNWLAKVCFSLCAMVLLALTTSANAAMSPLDSKPPTMPSTQSVVFLLYHHIDTTTPAVTSTTPAQFAAHLAYLKQHDYQVISISQALAGIYQDKRLPQKSVVITFDDGYQSIYQHAWPLLKRYNYPFTVFIDTHSVPEQSGLMMSWQQLKTMKQAGVTIANHSKNHQHMIGLSKQQLQYELLAAQAELTEHLGATEPLFAYPYGEFDQRLVEVLAAHNFYGFSQVSGAASYYNAPQAIPRFSFSGVYANLDGFALKVASQAMPVTAIEPQNPYFQSAPNRLTLSFIDDWLLLNRVSCFYLSEPLPSKLVKNNKLVISLPKALPTGRARINCTAPTGQENQYYWRSIPLFIEPEQGVWPE